MERNDSNRQCLSLTEIKAYLNNAVNEQEKVLYANHFSSCELCKEVKDSFSTVNQLGIEEDITNLKGALFDTVNKRNLKTRRRFLTNIAAGFLLPLTGAATFFYWNTTSNNRLYQANFQSYTIPEMTTRGTATTSYEDISLPKDLKVAVQHYTAKKYKESLPYFEAYRKKQPQNTYATFLHGMANLEENNIDAAIPFLEEVRLNDTNLKEDASWYLALAYTKKKNKTVAIKLLSELINTSKFYAPKAKKLKSKL